jgi:hypothetical protein
MADKTAAMLPDEVRDWLHKVLAYMVESEAKSYWLRCTPEERETWAYASAVPLMHFFGFTDLLDEDASWRRVDDDEAVEPEGL